MIEIKDVRQLEGVYQRRWFTSTEMDLVLWLDQAANLCGWQFCYDKGQSEYAVSWHQSSGWRHQKVDDGEAEAILSHKSTPLLQEEQDFSPVQQRVLNLFMANASAVPPQYVEQICASMADWPNLAQTGGMDDGNIA